MIFKAIIDKKKKDSQGRLSYSEIECKVIVVQNERELKFEILTILSDKGNYDEVSLRDIFNISEPIKMGR